MTHWIDKLVANDQAKTEQHRTQDELRLHRAKIIEAKTPAFWDAVLRQLGSDCAKLRDSCPDDSSRHCNLFKSGIDWELQSSKLPWRILNMRLNAKGQSVDIVESIKEARDTPATPAPSEQIKISVNSDDELQFQYRGRLHTTPDSLAEYLIRHVCDIREQ